MEFIDAKRRRALRTVMSEHCFLRTLILLAFLLTFSSVSGIPTLQGIYVEDRDHWYSDAKSHIQMLLDSEKISKGRAKNIILFVGDGMGMTTVTASRILKGQQMGHTGEEFQLAFEKFPYTAFAKTYTLDSQIGDSSACATALMCGVKANVNTVGLDHRGRYENCFSSFTGRATSIIEWAQKHGKSTGIVTNTRLTHGTPSALYAHSASRYWEDDSKMSDTVKASCKDIARQLVEEDPGKNINVLLGGGRRHWIPNTEFDREARTEQGRRQDGRNLIDMWVRDKKDRDLHAEYVLNKQQFDEIDPRKTDYLLGLFGYSHLDFEGDRNKGPAGDPSLAEMTQKAIRILQRNPHGFFLMVEGGRIDHAHHHNNGRRALMEVGAMEEAVVAALALTQRDDTLVVVTSDHSHVLSFGGENTPRGHPITAGRMDHAHHYNMAGRALEEAITMEESVLAALKMVDIKDTLILVTGDHSHTLTFGGIKVPRGHPVLGFDSEISDFDFKPYTTLLYGTGPGYAHSSPSGRQNLTGINPEDINFVQQAAVPRKYETHGGEDVPVYAIGPGAYLFSGTIEQTYIPHALAFAACISPDSSHCEQPHSDDASAPDVPRPLYPRQEEAPSPQVPIAPASAPVEERKRPREQWTWISSSTTSFRYSKWPPWIGVLVALRILR